MEKWKKTIGDMHTDIATATGSRKVQFDNIVLKHLLPPQCKTDMSHTSYKRSTNSRHFSISKPPRELRGEKLPKILQGCLKNKRISLKTQFQKAVREKTVALHTSMILAETEFDKMGGAIDFSPRPVELKSARSRVDWNKFKDLHLKACSHLQNLHGITEDLDLTFNFMMDPEFAVKDSVEKDEGDFNMLFDFLQSKFKEPGLSKDNLSTNLPSILSELRECSKILRYIQKSLLPINEHKALSIDLIWKSVLLHIEKLLRNQDNLVKFKIKDIIKETEETIKTSQEQITALNFELQEARKSLAQAQTSQNDLIAKFNKEKAQRERVLSSKNNQICELLNPHRFIFVHHFLSEFQYKFDTSIEERLKKINNVLDLFQVLEMDDILAYEVNEESASDSWINNKIGMENKLGGRFVSKLSK